MIEEIFNLFDTDGEQQLDEEELAAAVFAMGFSQHDHVQVPEQHHNNTEFSISETMQRHSRKHRGDGAERESRRGHEE